MDGIPTYQQCTRPLEYIWHYLSKWLAGGVWLITAVGILIVPMATPHWKYDEQFEDSIANCSNCTIEQFEDPLGITVIAPQSYMFFTHYSESYQS